MQTVENQEEAERRQAEKQAEQSDINLTEEDLHVEAKIVERKPVHLIGTMAKRQRELLDQAARGLVHLEAHRNAVEGQIDRKYGNDIEQLESNRTRVLEMLRAIEADLLALKTERRDRKVKNQTEYEENKAAQQKLVDGLRILVNTLES